MLATAPADLLLPRSPSAADAGGADVAATSTDVLPPTASAATSVAATQAPDDLRGLAVRSALWIALQKWGNSAAGIVVFALLGRLLAPADIGLAALAMVFVAFFQVLADQGFATALIQKLEIDDDDKSTAFWVVFGSAVALVALTVGLSPVVSSVFGEPRLGGVLCALSPVLLLSALAGVPEALLEREFRFASLTQRTLLGAVVGGIAGVGTALAGGGVWSIVVQALVTNLVAVVFLWATIDWRPRWTMSRTSLHALRATGLSVLGIRFVALINAQGDKLMVGAFLGPRELGYYYIGIQIVSMLLDIQTSVVESMSLTTLSKIQTDTARVRNAFYALTGVGAASAIGTFAIVAATAPVLLPFVFGSQWEPAAVIMQVLCLMGCLNAIIVFDRNALIAVGAARAALVITTVQAVVGLVAVAVVVPWGGALAVAVAVVVRQYLVWPLRLRSLRRALGIRIRTYLLHWVGPMFSGLVVFAAGSAIGWVWRPGSHGGHAVAYLAAQGVVGVVIYAVVLRLAAPMAYREMHGLVTSLLAKLPGRRKGTVMVGGRG